MHAVVWAIRPGERGEMERPNLEGRGGCAEDETLREAPSVNLRNLREACSHLDPQEHHRNPNDP